LVLREAHTDRLQRRPIPSGRHATPLRLAFPRNEKPKGLEPAQPSIASANRYPATAAQFNGRQLFERTGAQNFQGLRIQERVGELQVVQGEGPVVSVPGRWIGRG